jgi:hypothetical protein
LTPEDFAKVMEFLKHSARCNMDRRHQESR